MILKIIEYIAGLITFSVKGSFCDMFFKDCKQRGISLFDIRSKNGIYICSTTISDYKKMRIIRRKSRVKLKIRHKYGLRFFIHRHRYRIGIPLGIFLSVIFIIFASNRIWCIEIVGCENINQEIIYNSLEKLNIKTGIRKNVIKNDDLSHLMVINTPEIVWCAFNLNGSVLTVEIDERTFAPETTNQKLPCNIIADCDGIISSIEVLKGVAQTVKDSAFKKGDILVSGINELSNGTTVFLHSSAVIYGITEETITLEIPLKHTETVKTGKKKVTKYLGLYNTEIPLFLLPPDMKECEKQISVKQLNLLNRTLPVSLTLVTFYETTQKEVVYTEAQAKNVLNDLIEKTEQTSFKNAEIIEKHTTYSLNQDTLSATLKYVVKKRVGKQQEINITS